MTRIIFVRKSHFLEPKWMVFLVLFSTALKIQTPSKILQKKTTSTLRRPKTRFSTSNDENVYAQITTSYLPAWVWNNLREEFDVWSKFLLHVTEEECSALGSNNPHTPLHRTGSHLQNFSIEYVYPFLTGGLCVGLSNNSDLISILTAAWNTAYCQWDVREITIRQIW